MVHAAGHAALVVAVGVQAAGWRRKEGDQKGLCGFWVACAHVFPDKGRGSR